MNRWIRTSVGAKSVSPKTAAPKRTPSLHAACGDVEGKARIGGAHVLRGVSIGADRLHLFENTSLYFLPTHG
jgi:hypothetical protein